ncbi:hypothetical protein B0H11DRAFT_2039671, partial [Mycena galericulata]
MWKSRWGIAKIIYLWNRYFSLIVIILITVIVRDIGSSVVCIYGILEAMDLPKSLRVWILYGRPMWMVWFFALLGIGSLPQLASWLLLIVSQLSQKWTLMVDVEYIHLGSIIKGCYAYNVPRVLTLYAAAPLLVTFVMFVMTLYKCGVTFCRADHRVMPLWTLFLRDGVIWFVLVFAAGGSELLIWSMRRETLKQLLLV